MTYYLYDARGYVGDLASTHGRELMSDFVLKVTDKPEVKRLFENGTSPVTKELVDGLEAVHSPNKAVANTIHNLVNLLMKCKTVAIISDGVGVESPKLTIYRGTHEIGGSCVEISSSSGNTRVIIDIGMPLVNADGSSFEWAVHRKSSPSSLLEQKILPKIEGLYEDDKPQVTAVLLSHAHIDHYGFLRFVHPDIPVYVSAGTRSLAEVSNLFLCTEVKLNSLKIFDMWKPFRLGEFTVTPYLMDHSAPDAAAFLIEVDGKRIFYTGDFRGHGRKSILLERLKKDPPVNVDYLVMEGSMLGRDEGLYPDENSVEKALENLFSTGNNPFYVFTSSQNMDRLVSIYKAARHTSKTLVIDLYTAFVLDKLGSIFSSIPQFSWKGVRVLYLFSHAEKLAGLDKGLLYKYKKTKIVQQEILDFPEDKVLLCKDNRYYRTIIKKLKDKSSATAIYSMWHGYLQRTDLEQFLQSNGVSLREIHASGHAYVSQLEALAGALKPRWIVPIHTFHPEKFREMFHNVIWPDDGETLSLC